MNWVELFGSREYDFPLEIEPGSSFVGGAAYPDALVIDAHFRYPQRILVQTMDLDVGDETGRREKIRVTRVVAELPPHDLIELSRTAAKIEEESAIDTTVCSGCGEKIIEGQHVIVDGAAYHKRCISESEEERDARRHRRDPGGDRSGDSGGARGDRSQGTSEDGARVPPEATPKAVTKGFSDDGRRITHTATIVRSGEDDLVTFTTYARSGSCFGRWENGFAVTDIPRECDVLYFNEKFFASHEVVKAHELRLLNRLYLDALEELGR